MYNRPRSMRGNRSVDYVMPFLIIICLGVIVILLFNLWRIVFTEEPAKAAYVHVADGSVQMKTWGTDTFFDINSDVVMMQGDAIRTSSDAKIIVEFFDGTLMRVDSDSDLALSVVDDDEDNPEIQLNLVDGNIWFNRVYKNTRLTDVIVNAEAITVKSDQAGIFEVEGGENPTVRVFEVFENEGLLVEIMDQEGKKVIESENVGVGQEIVFNNAVLNKYWQYQSPNVLAAVSDEFKLTDWYLWNSAEDLSPTQFEKYASDEGMGLKVVEPEEKIEVTDGETDDAGADAEAGADAGSDAGSDATEPEEAVDLGPLTKPAIISVSGGTQIDANGFYNISGKLATITGSVSGAAKVVVNGYTLQRFKPGDTTWTYFANADYGLMQEGENIYEVYALDAAGNKSEVLTVKVLYTPPVPVVEVVEDAADAADSEAESGAETSEGAAPVD